MEDFFTISSDKDEFTKSSDEDDFKPIKVKLRRVCDDDFNVVKHKQHGATSIYVLRKDLNTKPWEKYCTIDDFVKTKYNDRKANVRLHSPGLVFYFKQWETLINGGLEIIGFTNAKITFVWGNMMYPKTKLTHRIIPQPKNFILKSVFINKEGKAYPQLWLE